MADLTELPVKEALIIRPGDHLIVCCDSDITLEDIAFIKERIHEEMPLLAGSTIFAGVNKLAVLREADNG